MKRFQMGVFVILMLAAMGLARCAKEPPTPPTTIQDETHCIIYFFSGGALMGRWEPAKLDMFRAGSETRFSEAGLDYQVSGDVVVECGHLNP